MGLAETKIEGQGIEELQGGIWLYNHGKSEEDKDAKGIGFLIHPRITKHVKEVKSFLIHPRITNHVKEVKSFSNRVVTLNLQLSGNHQICLIQVYAPTSDYDDEVLETFYEDVSKAIEENKAKYTIVMGDFNAKVGERQPEEETTDPRKIWLWTEK